MTRFKANLTKALFVAAIGLCGTQFSDPLTSILSARADEPTSQVLAAFSCSKELDVEQGQKIVAATQENFSKIKTLRAQFFQDSYLSSVDQSEMSSGKVSLMRPGKMRWMYESPEEQLFIVKDTSLWLYQPRLRQVVVDSLDKVLLSQLPTAFLMGVGDLSKDFTLKSSCETRGAFKLVLHPSNTSAEAGELAAFDLLTDKTSYLPLGAQVVDVGGNRTSILMKSLVAGDLTIKENDFDFQAPADIDIDDRRKS